MPQSTSACPHCASLAQAAAAAAIHVGPCPSCGRLPGGGADCRYAVTASAAIPTSQAITAGLPPPPAPEVILWRLKCLRKVRSVRLPKCPDCGGTESVTRTVIPEAAWGLFGSLCALIVTLPVCWLPLLALRETHRYCAACGARLRTRTRTRV